MGARITNTQLDAFERALARLHSLALPFPVSEHAEYSHMEVRRRPRIPRKLAVEEFLAELAIILHRGPGSP